MVATENTEIWYGFLVKNTELHRLYQASSQRDVLGLGTHYYWAHSQDDHVRLAREQKAYTAFVNQKMIDVFRPLYDIIDDDEQDVPTEDWWNKPGAPVQLLGDLWCKDGKLLVAFGRPAFRTGHCEEAVHYFRPYDPAIFERIQSSHRKEAEAAAAEMASWGLEISPVAWYRHEYTS
jgi:hypothetical protein